MGATIASILHSAGSGTVEELRHYGTKGMRWGIRKKRGSSVKKASKPKKRSIKDMSDAELRERINRINMERQYSQLTRTRGQVVGRTAAKITGDIALNVGKQIVSAQLAKYGNMGVEQLLKAAGAK